MMSYVTEVAQLIRKKLAPKHIPDASEELFNIYAVLVLSKGNKVVADDVHNAWAAWMSIKDPDHDSLVPYKQLNKETQKMDEPYLRAIREVAREMRS